MAVDWNEGQLTPAGKATTEDPAGSGFLPRRLKCCPRKATVRRGNQHALYKSLAQSPYISGAKIAHRFSFEITCLVMFQTSFMRVYSNKIGKGSNIPLQYGAICN